MSPSKPPLQTNPHVRSVSACFPCYNDAESIGKMVRDVRAALLPIVSELEIIVTNDGSSDHSLEVLRDLQTEIPELRVINHEVNRGYGGALLSCFSAATNEWIFYTDGDAQYDATEAADLVARVTAETDIVQGYKVGRGDRWYRTVTGRVYHHVVKSLFALHVKDTDCDFRLFRRTFLEQAELRATTGVICVEMMRGFERAGARFVEIPVSHYARPHGRSQFFRLPQISRAAVGLAQLWWRLIVRPQR